MGSGLLEQLAFARFVDRGDFARYLRRVRPIYRARRDTTIAALGELLPDTRSQGAAAGLQLHVTLPGDVDVPAARARHLRARGPRRGRRRALGGPGRRPPSLVLGYGELSEPTIQRAISSSRRRDQRVKRSSVTGRLPRAARSSPLRARPARNRLAHDEPEAATSAGVAGRASVRRSPCAA